MKTSIRVEFIVDDDGHGAARRPASGGPNDVCTAILVLDPHPP